MSTYTVCFKFLSRVHTIQLPENRGIADIREGFWVDADYNWCPMSKDKYYVMPHMIAWVRIDKSEDT